MNLEKFTERSRGFLQAAQTIAMRESHQRLAPEHLLKALMDDEQGLSSNLIRRAGGEPARVSEALALAAEHQSRDSDTILKRQSRIGQRKRWTWQEHLHGSK